METKLNNLEQSGKTNNLVVSVIPGTAEVKE